MRNVTIQNELDKVPLSRALQGEGREGNAQSVRVLSPVTHDKTRYVLSCSLESLPARRQSSGSQASGTPNVLTQAQRGRNILLCFFSSYGKTQELESPGVDRAVRTWLPETKNKELGTTSGPSSEKEERAMKWDRKGRQERLGEKKKACSSDLFLFLLHLQLIKNLIAIIPGIQLLLTGVIAEAGMGTVSAGEIREGSPFGA